jgi:hypothetical protein
VEYNLRYISCFKEVYFFETKFEEESMRVKLYSLGAGVFLASLIFSACGGNESGGVVNTTNANRSNSNNTAVVVNANNSNTSTVNSVTNAISNLWGNANSVTREEYNGRRAEYEKERRGDETIGQGANDSWIWFKTRAALFAANDLRDSTINVDVNNNVVTLKGTVASAAQKASAEKAAKGVEGVSRVQNQLQVRAEDSVTNVNTGSMTNGNTNRK